MGEIVKAGADRGFQEAVHMGDGLYAAPDGRVYPITNWFGLDCLPCPKEEAVVAVAGRCFVWFAIPLASFGIGPLAQEEPIYG